MNRDKATSYAINALLWLADNQQSLERFLNASGANADDLRERAQDPEFLGFVLDFFMTSDELITTLSEARRASITLRGQENFTIWQIK